MENIFRFCAKSAADLDAFHPGSAEVVMPRHLTVAERLADAEDTLLDMAIERSLAGEGEMRDLALSIIAIRAEMRG